MRPSPNCASPSFSVICAANFCSSAISASVETLLAFPLLRPLQRRHGVVRPDALEIRMSVGRARHQPLRGSLGDGDCGGRGQRACDREDGEPIHLFPPADAESLPRPVGRCGANCASSADARVRPRNLRDDRWETTGVYRFGSGAWPSAPAAIPALTMTPRARRAAGSIGGSMVARRASCRSMNAVSRSSRHQPPRASSRIIS